MLHRYTMHRGRRPDDDPLPDGIRQDTRRHTTHCLRPPRDLVDAYLAAPSDDAWQTFEAAYMKTLEDRYATDPAPFEVLAALACSEDVHIGCSCPTRKNPDVNRCHTTLALRFMQSKFDDLPVCMPT